MVDEPLKEGEKQQEEELKVAVIPESEAPKMSAGLFEPDKNHILAYMKFISMNQPYLKARGHRMEDVIASNENPGYFLYGEVEQMRKFLHKMLDECIDEAAEASKLNP